MTTRPLMIFSLAMSVFGFTQGGFLGALTGFWATAFIGISLGLHPLNDLAPIRSGLGIIQRASALILGTLTIAGVMLGGWRWGWAWSLLAMCCCVGFGIGARLLFGIPLSDSPFSLSNIDDKVIRALQLLLVEDDRCKPLFPEDHERKAVEHLITDRIVALFKQNTSKESQRVAIRTESLKWQSIFDPQRLTAEGQDYLLEALKHASLETRIDFCVTRVAGWIFESEYKDTLINWY